MAKATTTEIEVTQTVKGIVLELTEGEATTLRSVLGNTNSSLNKRLGLTGVWAALKDAVDFDGDIDASIKEDE